MTVGLGEQCGPVAVFVNIVLLPSAKALVGICDF